MKRTLLVALTLVLAVAFTTSAFAGADRKDVQATFKNEQVEANLLAGINSNNSGLRTSAAMMLGDLRSSNAVLPLMRMLKNESDERGRIVAALALYKIGSPVGIYAVKQTARFDNSERVRKLCALFYQEFQQVRSES
jgi:HEAT repeat protein